jgi:hypothetical protein
MQMLVYYYLDIIIVEALRLPTQQDSGQALRATS